MVKLFVVAVALFGAVVLLNQFVPQAWGAGFDIPIGDGVRFPWAFCLLGGFLWMAWSLKGK